MQALASGRILLNPAPPLGVAVSEEIEDGLPAELGVILAGKLPDGSADPIFAAQGDVVAPGKVQEGVVHVDDDTMGVDQRRRNRHGGKSAGVVGWRCGHGRGVEGSGQAPIKRKKQALSPTTKLIEPRTPRVSPGPRPPPWASSCRW